MLYKTIYLEKEIAMHLLTKKILSFLVFACVSSIATIAMETEDDPMGDKEAAAMYGKAEHLTPWEENFRKAAASYDTPYENFKNEALAFLESYKETHPTSNIGLEDLIVVEKPDPSILESAVAKYLEAYPATTEAEIEEFMALNQPSPKFLIPNEY